MKRIFFIFYTIILFSSFFSYPPESSGQNIPDISAPSQLLLEAEKAQVAGDFELSIKLLEKALSNSRLNEDLKLKIVLSLGLSCWQSGDISRSKEKFVNAKTLAGELNNISAESLAESAIKIIDYYNEGKGFRATGKYEEAIQAFRQAVKISQAINHPEFEIKCNRLLSSVYWELSDYQTFFSLNRHNMDLLKKAKNIKEEIRCLNNLGIYHLHYVIDLNSALRYLHQAYILAKKRDLTEEVADPSTNLGILYSKLGNYDKALDYIQQALTIDRKINNVANIAYDLINLGYTLRLSYVDDQNPLYLEKAKKNFEEALKISTKINLISIQIIALINLGTVYSISGFYDKAIGYYLNAEKLTSRINDPVNLGIIYNNLGINYAKTGNSQKSFEYFDKAIKLASVSRTGGFLWETFFEIGNNQKKQGLFEDGLKSYQRAVYLIEAIRSTITSEELRASYLGGDRRLEVYYSLIDLLVKSGKNLSGSDNLAEAFAYAERAKARAFLDSLETAEVEISHGKNQEFTLREKQLERELSQTYSKLLSAGLPEAEKKKTEALINNLEDQLDAIKREMRLKSPAYADLRYPKTLSLDEARKLLSDKETAFLEYSIGEESSYSFLITRKGIQASQIPGKSDLRKKIIAYRKSLSDPENSNFDLGLELFENLIPKNISPEIKNIIIVPDDMLSILPFEALLINRNPKHWLIEKYAISYAPSISSLSVLMKRRQTGPSPNRAFLAFGDPVYRLNGARSKDGLDNAVMTFWGSLGTSQLERLRYSGVEAAESARLFKAGNSDLFLGEKATETAFKSLPLTNYKIIHLAAHAVVDDKNPMRSSVILTADNNHAEDGLLQMREIFNLRLNADLVTLSACQTGLGQFIRGEGISSLSRAFFYAGSSSVCVSLWPVNDETTYQLMNRFYYYIRTGLPIKEALRKTKIEMIKSGVLAHPCYWAPFVVSGKADTKITLRATSPAFLLLVPAIIGIAVFLSLRISSQWNPDRFL